MISRLPLFCQFLALLLLSALWPFPAETAQMAPPPRMTRLAAAELQAYIQCHPTG